VAIATDGVSKRFDGNPVPAVDDVSIDVAEGSLTALLGPSGCGKSTLLRIVAGLEQPDSGRVLVEGLDVTNVPPRDRGLGFVFQHYAPFRHLTVRRNVAFALEVRKRPKKEIAARVDELLHLVQLEALADRYPSQISGGQRQRMALARALAAEPRVLLLDEPFGALDASVRAELRGWLRRLHDETGTTTLLVTHDQEEAMEVADQVVVMRSGRIEQAGSPRDVYDHPANAWVMGFVGPTTRIDQHLVRPHDLAITRTPDDDTRAATVVGVLHLGFEVRVELELLTGGHASAQLTREQAAELALEPGDSIFIAPPQGRRSTTTSVALIDAVAATPGRSPSSSAASRDISETTR
jgi:sulfate transport system ATP-binding protein